MIITFQIIVLIMAVISFMGVISSKDKSEQTNFVIVSIASLAAFIIITFL